MLPLAVDVSDELVAAPRVLVIVIAPLKRRFHVGEHRRASEDLLDGGITDS
jgi:hypothetical protein